jgi:sugar lactone lactonase YvrE
MRKILLILPAIMTVASCTPTNNPAQQSSTPPASSYYTVSTYATFSGQFGNPIGVAADSSGNLYACDATSGIVWKIAPPDSTVSTITTINDQTSDIVCDRQGNLYVLAVGQGKILKITPAGVVTTLAGGASGQVDGQGSAAGFKALDAMDIDSTGTIYVADYLSVRRVDQAGNVKTLYIDSTAGEQMLGIACDNNQNVYFAADVEVFRLDSLGNRTFIAGQSVPGNQDGTAGSAAFEGINELRMDKSGNLWVNDYNTLRMITPSAVVTTVAGNGITGFMDGAGNVAEFDFPVGLAIAAGGTLFVADDENRRIRKIIYK